MTDIDDILTSPGERPFVTLQLCDILEDDPSFFETLFTTACGVWGTPTALGVKSKVSRVFNNRNYYKEIVCETEEAWAVALSRLLDENLGWFEEGLKMYATVDMDDTGVHQHTDGQTVFQDTPDGSLTGTYATNVTDTSQDTVQHRGSGLEEANNQIDAVRNLIVDFVKAFDVAFMNTSARM